MQLAEAIEKYHLQSAPLRQWSPFMCPYESGLLSCVPVHERIPSSRCPHLRHQEDRKVPAKQTAWSIGSALVKGPFRVPFRRRFYKQSNGLIVSINPNVRLYASLASCTKTCKNVCNFLCEKIANQARQGNRLALRTRNVQKLFLNVLCCSK